MLLRDQNTHRSKLPKNSGQLHALQAFCEDNSSPPCVAHVCIFLAGMIVFLLLVWATLGHKLAAKYVLAVYSPRKQKHTALLSCQTSLHFVQLLAPAGAAVHSMPCTRQLCVPICTLCSNRFGCIIDNHLLLDNGSQLDCITMTVCVAQSCHAPLQQQVCL